MQQREAAVKVFLRGCGAADRKAHRAQRVDGVGGGTAAGRQAADAEGHGQDRRGRRGPVAANRPPAHQCAAALRSEYGAAPMIAAMIVKTSWYTATENQSIVL